MKLIALLLLVPTLLLAQRPSFTLSRDKIELPDYAEITLDLPPVKSGNPFTDVLLTGVFVGPANDTTRVEGFCDTPDGSKHRIRFRPTKPGMYRFTVKSYAIRRRQINHVLTTGRAQTGSYSGLFVSTTGATQP